MQYAIFGKVVAGDSVLAKMELVSLQLSTGPFEFNIFLNTIWAVLTNSAQTPVFVFFHLISSF